MTAEWLSDEAGGGGDVSSASLHAELARELEQRGAEASCKSAFVLALLGRLAAAGHRTLIFSQSKVMLSILEVCGEGAGTCGCEICWKRSRYGHACTKCRVCAMFSNGPAMVCC